ncbi:MAG TPA: hypothetical protein VMR25_18980 [Planctomycetaceae bacterium]|jgi:hypothetical protein|nr:hypothetical protein [Planctomycetaceae bacterium]
MKVGRIVMVVVGICCIAAGLRAAEPDRSDPAYYHQGELAGSLAAAAPSPRGPRAATWKSRHETYRRLLDYLGE